MAVGVADWGQEKNGAPYTGASVQYNRSLLLKSITSEELSERLQIHPLPGEGVGEASTYALDLRGASTATGLG